MERNRNRIIAALSKVKWESPVPEERARQPETMGKSVRLEPNTVRSTESLENSWSGTLVLLIVNLLE